MKRALFAAAVLAGAVSALLADGVPAPAPEPINPCQIGSVSLGMELPDVHKNHKKFNHTKFQIIEPQFGITYEVRPTTPYRRDLLAIVGSRVWAVTREYYGDDAKVIYATLKERYGEPKSYEVSRDHRQQFLDVQENSEASDRALWIDEACGYEIELVRPAKTFARPWKGGGLQMLRAAAVMFRPIQGPKTDPALLK